MAKEDYTTKLDSVLAEAVTDDKEYNKIISSLSTAPTFTDKFKVVQALALKYPTNLSIVDAATQWLKDNSGDLYDSSTSTYLSDGVYRNAILEANIKGKPLNTLFTKINQLRTDNVSNALKETAPDLSKTEFDTSVTELTNGSKTTPYNPAKYIAVASKGTPAVAYKKGMTADQLKASYGSLIDPTTKKPVFTSQQLEDVANGVASASAFNKKINSLATDAVNKSQDWSLYGGKTGSAYVSAIKNMVSDPSKLATVYKAPDVTDTSVKGGSGIDELITPITTTGAKTGQVPSLKTWHAPQQGVATANSPYSGLLDATLAKVTGANFGTPTNNAVYKNLTDPLTQGMGLDSLPKPKLIYDTANTAGITGLGDVKGTLQSLNTQVTSTPTYNPNQIANANTALEKAAADAKRIADEKAAADAKRIADEKAAANKALLSKYNFNNYISPETRAAFASNSDFYKSIATTTPGLADQIKYSNLIDSLSGNTGITTTTAGSQQGASNFANKYNPITTPTTNDYGQYADFRQAVAGGMTQDQINVLDEARNRAAMTASAGANNGIATNTGGFTSASNMNTNATGSNGASSIVSLLPSSPAPVNNTPQTIYGVDPNQVNLTMAPNNQPAPVNNTPQTIDLSGVVNNPAVLNITNAQQQPVNNTPNYATGLTLNTSPINAAPVNNPAVLNLTTAPANDYGQYKDLNAAVAGGMTQDQINAADTQRNMRAMGLIP